MGQLAQLERITTLLARADATIRRRFLQLVDGAENLTGLEDIAAHLERGDIAAALRLTEEIGPGIATAFETAYAAAGQSAAAVLRSHRTTLIDFSTLGARAQDSLSSTRLRLVREFNVGQRNAAMEMLDDSFRRGLAPIEQARQLKQSIGLTQHQARAVTNFRRALESGSSDALRRELRDHRFDGSIRAAIRGDRVLSPEQIDKMVERYRQRYVQYRARTIARTESLRAINQGEEEMWQQAVDAGAIDPDSISSIWFTAADERVRGSHKPMNRQSRPFGTPFTSGNGASLMYPGDPNAPGGETINCRCVLARKILRERRPDPGEEAIAS